MSDPIERPTICDSAGNRLGLGDHVTYAGDDLIYIVTRLDPPKSLVHISCAGKEHRMVPALLCRVGAPVSIGEEVSDGRDQFVVLGVLDDVLFCEPVFGGPVVELGRGSVRRVGERPAVPSTVLDLGDVMSMFGQRPAARGDVPREGRVLPLRRRADGAA